MTASLTDLHFTRRPMRVSGWSAWDVWIIVVFSTLILGTFYPLESYLSLGQGEGMTGYRSLPFPATTLTLVVSSLTLLCAIPQCLRQGLKHNVLAYLFMLVAFASAAWAPDPVLSTQRAIRLFPLIGFGVILPQVYSADKLLKLLVISVLTSACASLFMSVAVPSLGASRLGGGYESAWRGATIHKNLLGFISALSILLTLAAWYNKAVSARLAVISVLINLLLLARSESGTGALACGAGLATFALAIMLRYCPRPTRPLILMSGLMLTAAGIVGAMMVLETLLEAGGRDMTLTGRTDIWKAVWTMIQMHPVRGYGYAFWLSDSPTRAWIWKQIGDTAAHSHDSWLDVWLQLGLPGLLLLIPLVTVPLYRAMRAIVRGSDKEAMLGAALLPLIVAMLVRSISEVEFTEPLPQAIPFMVLIYAMFQREPRQRGGSSQT